MNFEKLPPALIASLRKQYAENNYYESPLAANNYFYIFPSSNGLFFPNEHDSFKEIVVEKNKFEWRSIISEINLNADYIFLRDIHKQWYLRGINTKINSIASIVDFIKSKTNGRKIRAVGSSSGGFLSTIIGLELGAEYVLSFSGQFQLTATAKDDPVENPWVVGSSDNIYFSLEHLFLKNISTPVFYFVGDKSITDIPDLKFARRFRNIYTFILDSEVHGVPFAPFVLKYLLLKNVDELVALHERFDGRVVAPAELGVFLCGRRKYIEELIAWKAKSLKKKVVSVLKFKK